MGSRRADNRLSVSGPTTVALHHAKQHHEKRNHELMKRLSSDSTTKTPPSSKGVGDTAMTKSLTLEVGKGHLDQESSVGKARTRRKADVEKALKSLQRQTSSSAMKMSLSLNDKEQFMDNRMSRNRDSSPSKRKGQVRDPVKLTKKRDSVNGRSANPVGHGADRKGGGGGSPGAGENIKKADVFERLSRQDCNKGVAKSEHSPGNRIRDRSPAKAGRKSPQDGKTASDKHQTSRNLPSKTTTNRKRDGSPVKNEENGRKSVGSSQGIRGRRNMTREETRNGSPDPEDDKDGSREKLEKDNIPESPDKDTKDLEVSDDVDRIVIAASGVVNGNEIPPSSVREEVGGVSVGGGEGGRETLNASLEVNQRRSAKQQSVDQTTTTGLSRKLDPKVASPEKSSKDKVVDKSRVSSQISSSGPCKSSSLRTAEAVPRELSKAEVMQRVRQRVNDDDKRDAKDVIDDDKDVCEAEKCDEEEFYKIKVHTRLVSYSNSTLVIKNTSKVDGVGDYALEQSGDTESESSHPPSPPPPDTLQTSSMALPAVPDSDDVEADGATSLPTEGHQGDSSAFARTRSMRQKLSQFVSKGKNFLSDVYSATQTKLEHYTRGDSPCSSTSCSITSLDDEKVSPSAVLNDTDSGYYSISTSPEVTRPSPKESISGGAACLLNDTCEGGVRADQKSPKVLLSADGSSGKVDTPDNGMKIAGNVILSDCTQRDDDKNVVTAEATNVNEDDDAEDELPAIPQPHVNFTLNEEWIKKNILCTCKCNRNASKTRTVGNNTSASQTSDENLLNSDANTVVLDNPNTLEHEDSEPKSEDCVNSEDSIVTPTKDLDDLCLCSCHDGEEGQQHQQLPQEVQEILDADHARMWWTITGNFGNILPIDWSKTYTRQQYLPVLNLNEAKEMKNTSEDNDRNADDDDDAEEEEVAQDLDLHHLILNGLSAEPVKSAEEVIREIDDIMQEGSSSEDEGVEESSASGANSNETPTHPLPPPLYAEKLNNMSISELNEAYMELEIVIRQYSETLINQLALRDELEYEKELKNSFISLLLQVQNKRRNFNVEKKKQKKYLTTVIPYDVGHGPPQNETLQILIKILMAINEDSPTVPTLLTDYILKVLCPS